MNWQFWIDVGGTFTDCFSQSPDGETQRLKVLSSAVTKGAVTKGTNDNGSSFLDTARVADPDGFWSGYRVHFFRTDGDCVLDTVVTNFVAGEFQLPFPCPADAVRYELSSNEEAPILAIRRALQLGLNDPLPNCTMRLGTTRGTNALLTRSGARTALITTKGFGDVLRIGNQDRPHIFQLNIQRSELLYQRVVEADERINADGEVAQPLAVQPLRKQLVELLSDGIESVAICLLNAYCNDIHERQIAEMAREVGFEHVRASHAVAPLIKIVSRGDTTVVDAYLNPVLQDYVASLQQSLGEASDLRLLTSAGGLVSAEQFSGKDSILSGPAGGVVGFSRVALSVGFPRAIGFDMGGTSTDVSRFDGRFQFEYETQKAGVRIVAPMMAIETVAAGGGSICKFDGVKLTVGPASAGADPGPACYGRGGPLAVTDLNVALGKVPADQFPFPLDYEAVQVRLESLCETIETATGKRLEPRELAEGFLQVANANMAEAIRSISVAQGYDPSEFAMVAFGGAAAQHACAVAAALDINTIVNHPDAGVLSAMGIGLADVVRHGVRGVYKLYGETTAKNCEAIFAELATPLVEEVAKEGVAREAIETIRSLDLRYRGTDATLTVSPPSNGDYRDEFLEQHQRLYGYVHENKAIEIVAARVEVIGHSATDLPPSVSVEPKLAVPLRTTNLTFAGSQLAAPVYDRSALQPGDALTGPAVVFEATSTTVIDPGWRAEVLSEGELLLHRERVSNAAKFSEVANSKVAKSNDVDPVRLEIFNNHFAAIAEQMGITLRNTASSVNVKERLDFSCAIFTAAGELVVNAPHIPVHLGAMSETVKQLLERQAGSIFSGDVFVTNDPYRGGSHLPDITVVTPVFDSDERLLFYTASRAHHAEIGGITPGSMPPFSKNLSEEGIVLREFKAVERGESRYEQLREQLLSGPYPTRSVEDNLADISAQIAANQQGATDLMRLCDRFGWEIVSAYMKHIQNAAEQKMRRALAEFPDGRHQFKDHLDSGAQICVAIDVDGDEARVDFAGTADVLEGNLNANRAIATAAVMYCFRCLLNEDIPLNEGVLAPITIDLPTCLLNPPMSDDPRNCPAVVGGNVETSQRVVDCILGALGIAAASQGTMNNTLFGDESFGYYETVCGGSGATAQQPGTSAVHTHMTNTRITDPEVFEQRYPVRLLEFSIRKGSGGAGKHRGGDGVVRRIEFLKPLKLSLLTQRRGPYPPYGLQGGGAGSLGKNTLVKLDGTVQQLPAQTELNVEAGDQLKLETPGGGGFGDDGAKACSP